MISPPYASSLDTRLMETGGRPSGFDYLRLALAVLIVLFHTFEVSYGPEAQLAIFTSLWRSPVSLLLPMFFALSGFLVAGSLERNPNLFKFISLRILRIIPALAGEVLLCALIIGPIFTTLTHAQYFSDPVFFKYFNNIYGDVQYYLPGVFETNPLPAKVNPQLWTIPFELFCYVCLSGIALLGIFKRRWLLWPCMIAFYTWSICYIDLNKVRDPWVLEGPLMVLMFVCGMTMYRMRHKIPYSFPLFCTSLVIALLMLTQPKLDIFTIIPITYIAVYLGLLNPPRQSTLLSGDYSYGIFLYGYPVQQTVASFGPAFQHWYVSALVALPLAVVVAVASWHVIEKPALSLKRYLTNGTQNAIPAKTS